MRRSGLTSGRFTNGGCYSIRKNVNRTVILQFLTLTPSADGEGSCSELSRCGGGTGAASRETIMPDRCHSISSSPEKYEPRSSRSSLPRFR